MKKTIIAALLMAGVSTMAMAQTMSGSSDSSQSQNDSSMGGTGSAGGAMNGSPGMGTASPGAAPAGTADDATPGPTRPNSDFGSQAPATASTTPGTNVPTTTRNAAATDRAPLKGANSFTAGEATRRLNRAGYTNVAGLTKDDQSVYHATATKNGAQVNVAMDYRGTITEQPANQ